MAYAIQSQFIGLTPIAVIDAGIVPPNQATAIPSPPGYLGMIVTAQDPTLGVGEFILLTGVAALAVGSVVQYDASTFAPTIPTAATANKSGMPLAVSMAANTSTTAWSWFQVSGTAVCKKSTVKFSNKQAVGYGSTGLIVKSASGVQILGARSANVSSVASAITTLQVTINRPHMMGRIT